MKVKIEGIDLINNIYTEGKESWNVLTLIQASKDLEPFDLPLAGIYLGIDVWRDSKTILEFTQHVKRVQHTDLKYPVILTPEGFICDGWHRVVKALVMGHATIKAVRLDKMPLPDSTNKKINKR